jgi:Ion channel
MILQLLVGTGLMLACLLVAGVSFWMMEMFLLRVLPWFLREPHLPRLMFALMVIATWSLGTVTFAVWIWAIAFRAMGLFQDIEQALYFALTSFTSLGYGDVLLPREWQLLGGMAAANGLLNFGLLTAFFVDALRNMRISQMEERRRLHPHGARSWPIPSVGRTKTGHD